MRNKCKFSLPEQSRVNNGACACTSKSLNEWLASQCSANTNQLDVWPAQWARACWHHPILDVSKKACISSIASDARTKTARPATQMYQPNPTPLSHTITDAMITPRLAQAPGAQERRSQSAQSPPHDALTRQSIYFRCSDACRAPWL